MTTTRQDHNARVTLKMFGTLWLIDPGDCRIVGKLPIERTVASLHVKSRQFSVQHNCKPPSISLCVCVNRPVG